LAAAILAALLVAVLAAVDEALVLVDETAVVAMVAMLYVG
jgi:hypothetical protein